MQFDRSMRKRIFAHAGSFFTVFNFDLNATCPFVYEEIVLLSHQKRRSNMERLKRLVRLTGPGWELKSASVSFDVGTTIFYSLCCSFFIANEPAAKTAANLLHKPREAEKQMLQAFNLLIEIFKRQPEQGLLSPDASHSPQLCDMFVLVLR